VGLILSAFNADAGGGAHRFQLGAFQAAPAPGGGDLVMRSLPVALVDPPTQAAAAGEGGAAGTAAAATPGILLAEERAAFERACAAPSGASGSGGGDDTGGAALRAVHHAAVYAANLCQLADAALGPAARAARLRAAQATLRAEQLAGERRAMQELLPLHGA
jgi:hypothetical protein